MGVPTFGNLRIEAYLQLPAAYRSLSRPSSAPNAKAFSIYSSSLELPLVNIVCLPWFFDFFLAWIAVYHTLQFTRLSFIFVWQNCLNFYPVTEKPDFNLNWFLSFPLLLSVMYVTQILLKNLYDFSYSVFNEHSLNFRQGHLVFTKLLRYLIYSNTWEDQWSPRKNSFVLPGLKWTRTTDLALIRRAL